LVIQELRKYKKNFLENKRKPEHYTAEAAQNIIDWIEIKYYDTILSLGYSLGQLREFQLALMTFGIVNDVESMC
jgi:hypothetical protein